MKKTITLVVFFIAFAAAAQAQIPNASFENWTTMGGYSTPDGWDNFNALTASSGVYTCEKGSSSAPHGSSFLMLTTKLAGTTIVPGLAVCGKYDVATKKPKSGFPYTGRPGFITGKWQYMMQGTDSGSLAVLFTKWNTSTGKRDAVASLEYDITGMAMSWTSFSIPIPYLTGATPDTAVIGFVSTNKTGNAVAGSYLYIDDVNFSGFAAGVSSTTNMKYNLALSPNPAKDKLSINLGVTATDEVRLWVMDMYGKVVTETAWKPGNRSYSMDLNSVSPGLYFVKLMVGEEMQTKRLVVE